LAPLQSARAWQREQSVIRFSMRSLPPSLFAAGVDYRKEE
jgi:hypothetical protein